MESLPDVCAQITVVDAEKTAERLCRLFRWNVHWAANSVYWGTTICVGIGGNLIAVHSINQPGEDSKPVTGSVTQLQIFVENVGAVENQVLEMGFLTCVPVDQMLRNRFRFRDEDGIIFDVVSPCEMAA